MKLAPPGRGSKSMPTKDEIIEALKTIQDPELFLDIWFLGLIYDVEIEGAKVKVKMTFTSPMCPAGPELVWQVRHKIASITGVENVSVDVVFDPPWEPSEEVKAALGFL